MNSQMCRKVPDRWTNLVLPATGTANIPQNCAVVSTLIVRYAIRQSPLAKNGIGVPKPARAIPAYLGG